MKSVKIMTIIIFLLILVKSESGDNMSDKCQEKRNVKTANNIKAKTQQLITNFLKWEKEIQRKNPNFDFDREPTVMRKLRGRDVFCLVTRFLDARDFISTTSLNSLFYEKIRGTVSRYRNHLNQNFIDDFEMFFDRTVPEDQLVSTYFSIFCTFFGSNEKRWTRGEGGNLVNVHGDKVYLEDNSIIFEFPGGRRQKHKNMPLAVEQNGIYEAADFMKHFKVRLPSEDWRTDVVEAYPWAGVTVVSQLTPENFAKFSK